MPLDLDRYNQRVQDWTQSVQKEIIAEGKAEGITHRANSPSKGSSLDKIKSRVYQSGGVVDKVGIRFRRSLIYPHKGAGKGHGGEKGSTWVDGYGKNQKTNPDSFGKAGSGSRKAKPFFNKALSGASGTEALADIAAEELGAAIQNNILIK